MPCISILDVDIESKLGFSSLCSDIKIGEDVVKIWITVRSEYDSFIFKSADPFLVGILPFAMSHGYDIDIKVPVSEELVFNLNNILLPTLVAGDGRVHKVNIYANQFYNPIHDNKSVGANMSLGVDSFYAILSNSDGNHPFHKITHLLCYSFQTSMPYGESYIRKVYSASQELKLPLIEMWSNISTVFSSPGLLPSHTYWLAAAIMSLKKLWHTYHIASSYDCDKFSDVLHDDCSHYEYVLLSSLSTSDLSFKLSGYQISRFEKTKIISNNEVVMKYLTPCWTGDMKYNCNYCSKCIRTMLDLDAHQSLDKFEKCFDVDSFSDLKTYYHMYQYEHRNDVFFIDSFNVLKKNFPSDVDRIKSFFSKYRNKYPGVINWIYYAAANDGHVSAMKILSSYFDNKHDYDQSVFWAKKAFEADENLVYMYVDALIKRGGEKDYIESIKLCKTYDNLLIRYAFILSAGPTKYLNLQLASKLIKESHFLEDEFNIIIANVLIKNKDINYIEEICTVFHPNNNTAKLCLARIYRDNPELKKIDKSIDLLREVVILDPQYVLDLVDALLIRKSKNDISEAIEWCMLTSRWGYSGSMHRLAKLYYDGTYVKKNLQLYGYWLNLAANKNIKWFSEYFDYMVSSNKNLNSTIKLTEKYVEQGFPVAIIRLARLYRDGIGVKKSYDSAIKLMRKAVESEPNWSNEFFDLLWNAGTNESYKEMIDVAKSRAEAGDPNAMGRLGRAYNCGKGVEKNKDDAIMWMRKAYKLGPWWSNEFFDLLWNAGTNESYKEMIDVAKSRAEAGDPNAMGRLGRAYNCGKGVEKNKDVAIMWMTKAGKIFDYWNSELEHIKNE